MPCPDRGFRQTLERRRPAGLDGHVAVPVIARGLAGGRLRSGPRSLDRSGGAPALRRLLLRSDSASQRELYHVSLQYRQKAETTSVVEVSVTDDCVGWFARVLMLHASSVDIEDPRQTVLSGCVDRILSLFIDRSDVHHSVLGETHDYRNYPLSAQYNLIPKKWENAYIRRS